MATRLSGLPHEAIHRGRGPKSDQARVKSVIRDAVASRVLALVENEGVDIGFTRGDAPKAGVDVLCRGRDRLCVVFANGHPLGQRRRIALKDIVDLPLVLTDSATSVRAAVEAAFLAIGRQPTVACETTYMTTAVAIVSAGLGVTVLPSSAREILAFPVVSARPIEGAAFGRQILLIKKRGRTLSQSCDTFAKACIAAMKGAPAV